MNNQLQFFWLNHTCIFTVFRIPSLHVFLKNWQCAICIKTSASRQSKDNQQLVSIKGDSVRIRKKFFRCKVKWRQHKINIFLYFFTILTVCFGLKQIYFTDQLDCFTKHFHLKLYLKWIILTISWVFCTGWIVLKPVVNIVFCQCLHRFIFAGPYWIILECP